MTSDPRDIATLIAIMARLRDPKEGCPWDLAQNFASIAPYTIEEAYEVAGAIEEQDWASLRDELGDLLFQTVFHSRMAEELGLFNFADVVAAVVTKMVRRHPHVFGDSKGIDSPEAQTVAWEEHKAQERQEKAVQGQSLLGDVPKALPALLRAIKLQKRAATVGFDWDSPERVLDKLREEADEIVAARQQGGSDEEVAGEIGDLLFVVVNLARHLRVNPEDALRRTNAKFVRRFGVIERKLNEQGRGLNDATLAEMEELWQLAKRQE
ncbi:MAG: nucleoside triphosphate pyrophosphohydrolase [Alphaproteobacteria bacterium]|nr:nucleoside triphosphate pyrophosphohydrolase [Alphaproteobacteria bacterium]